MDMPPPTRLSIIDGQVQPSPLNGAYVFYKDLQNRISIWAGLEKVHKEDLKKVRERNFELREQLDEALGSARELNNVILANEARYKSQLAEKDERIEKLLNQLHVLMNTQTQSVAIVDRGFEGRRGVYMSEPPGGIAQ